MPPQDPPSGDTPPPAGAGQPDQAPPQAANASARQSGKPSPRPGKGRDKPQAERGATAKDAQRSGAPDGAVAMLKDDHRRVERLFMQFETADEHARIGLIEQLCRELTIHTILEEELFYPACRATKRAGEAIDDAQVEHDSAKLIVADIARARPDDPFRDAKVRVLAEQVRHHVREEEQPGTGILAVAEASGIDIPELAQRLRQRRTELQRSDRLPDLPSVAIAPQSPRSEKEDHDMASYQQGTRDRDDQGRFTGGGGRGGGRDQDDDRRSGQSDRGRDDDGRFTSGRRGGSSDRRDDDRRDDNRRDDDDGRGWHGDPRGHAEAARRGWDDRGPARASRQDDDDRRQSGRGGRDDDRGGRGGDGRGWYGDPRGHSEASRRGWDNPDHGPSGWYGDSRGHSEASRRGWDNPDHGPSGWYGDSRGHSEASRRGWDNPDHGRSGWFGDPEGHSEASRRGWDDRGDSRSSRGRDDDDDDRRGGPRSSRGGRDDEGRGRSSQGQDDDDRRGGWFGDSRGHAEAARRGWEHRR